MQVRQRRYNLNLLQDDKRCKLLHDIVRLASGKQRSGVVLSRLFFRSEGRQPSLFLELIVVVLGVILALGAEEYWAEQERMRLIKQNLKAVQAELEANAAQIKVSYDYHIVAGPKSFAALDFIEKTGSYADASWYNGFQVPLLRHAAFDTALQMGVWAETEVPVTAAVNEAYACFERIEKTADSYQQALAGTRRSDGTRFFNVIGFAYSQLSTNEERCIDAITVAQEALGAS